MTNSELKEHVASIGKYCYDENCSDCHFAFNDGDKCILNDEIPCDVCSKRDLEPCDKRKCVELIKEWLKEGVSNEWIRTMIND